MRVDSGTSSLGVSQRPQFAAASRASATPISTAQPPSQGDGVKQVDFTSMTRQEMRDWVNAQIRSGEMSLDDSRPFVAMTMKIPVNGGSGGELPAQSDGTRHDFAQKAREGIQGALSRNDEATLKMLELAMSIMQRQQGQAIGIDLRA